MNICLMHKNEIVMKINFDESVYEVVNRDKLPYQLKGRIPRIPDFSEIHSKFDDIERQKCIRKAYTAVESFFASRVLSISRDNAKKIYALFGFDQLQDDYSKAKIAITCRAVSLQDDYWIKNENDPSEWKDINLRHNSLSEIVAQVSLHGSSLTLQGKGKIITPELNGQGSYAKAWVRENDGLYLHKVGSRGSDYESQVEVMVSNILDNCNVEHVKYMASSSNGRYTCKCKCMTTDDLSILSGMDFISYCNVNNMNPMSEILKIDSESIYKMWIVDYLISNSDRHSMNWGFYYDSETMKITKCHPLFDHNNAFDEESMKNKDAKYIFDETKTMREAALYAIQKVDFHFIREFTPNDFMTKEQYDSFMDRAKELNIKTLEKAATLDDIIHEKSLSSNESGYIDDMER